MAMETGSEKDLLEMSLPPAIGKVDSRESSLVIN